MKLRNVSGYPLEIRKYRRVVGPDEVVDTGELGHDMDRDGVITGFEPVDDEPKQPNRSKAAEKAGDKDSKEQGK